jgi:hypothetical protein
MVQSLHIQQVKLETDGGAYQPGEKLEEVGDMPTQEELTEETNMSEEEAEQQLSEETTGLESAAEWQLSATRGNEDSMGDQVDLPIDKYGRRKCSREDCIRRASHWSNWTEVIEEIRR